MTNLNNNLFFINKDLQHLVPKLSSSDGQGLYKEYKERFVSKMNEVAKQFIGLLYTSQKEAANDFNLFLRSYMPGWVLHSGKTTKSTTGLVRTVYTCHTVSKKKKSEDVPDCGSCKWRAVLQQDETGAFSFKEISDFNMHRVECVQHFARFTPGEVSFQMDFGPSGRPKVMQHLHQNWVQQDTYKKRVNRSVQNAKAFLNGLEDGQLSGQEPDFQLTNLDTFTSEPETISKEGIELVRLVTFLVQKTGAYAWVVFESTNPKEVELAEVHIMWKDGAQLLETHGDAIWCDSLWSVSEDGDHLQTIVVMDKHSKLQLAAMCLVIKESTQSWFHFFKWVKQTVPLFNPQCVVTDGAAGIYNGFQQATSTSPCHIVCWWHRARCRDKKYGKSGFICRKCLRVSYAECPEMIQQIRDSVTRRLQRATVRERESAIAKNNDEAEKAFINLRVFTGNTLTNSYSESVNAQLRRYGIKYIGTRLHQLKLLCEFSLQFQKRVSKPFVPTTIMTEILDAQVLGTVANGTLSVVGTKIKKNTTIMQVITRNTNRN